MNNFGPCAKDCPNRKAGCSASCEAWNALKGVVMYTTPCAADVQGSHGGNNHRSLRTDVAGQLNPTWVEWLMGFPIGWTELNASETP